MITIALLTTLHLGDCVAAKDRPEGWPIYYQVTGVHSASLDVRTMVMPSERERVSVKAAWYKKHIYAHSKNYDKIACPKINYR